MLLLVALLVASAHAQSSLTNPLYHSGTTAGQKDWGSCTDYSGNAGQCGHMDACSARGGTSVRFRCPGPDEIRCCVGHDTSVVASSPAVSYVQPAVSYVQPAVSYVQPAVSYVQPSVSYAQPYRLDALGRPLDQWNRLMSPVGSTVIRYDALNRPIDQYGNLVYGAPYRPSYIPTPTYSTGSSTTDRVIAGLAGVAGIVGALRNNGNTAYQTYPTYSYPTSPRYYY